MGPFPKSEPEFVPKKVGRYIEIQPVSSERFEMPGEDVRWYRCGDKVVCVSKDVGLWHISISCKRRYPSWDEIHEARYLFAPDNCYMAMILPPKSEYVNLQENCFHLHELRRGEIPRARKESHPTFTQTICQSKEWKAWEEAAYMRFDVAESRECGWLSPEHWAAFVEFIKGGLK